MLHCFFARLIHSWVLFVYSSHSSFKGPLWKPINVAIDDNERWTNLINKEEFYSNLRRTLHIVGIETLSQSYKVCPPEVIPDMILGHLMKNVSSLMYPIKECRLKNWCCFSDLSNPELPRTLLIFFDVKKFPNLDWNKGISWRCVVELHIDVTTCQNKYDSR